MKSALINLDSPYRVAVVPTEMRYSLQKDMFDNEGQKLCEIQYEILAGKYVSLVAKLDEKGNPVLKGGKPVTEEILVDFSSPILYHSATKTIPFELYLLIESYRATKSKEMLEQINFYLQNFVFDGSLADFKLIISDVN